MSVQFSLFDEMPDKEVRPRRLTKQQQHWRDQPFLIPQSQIAQFGVNGKPLIHLSETTALALESVDPRTDAEREADERKHMQSLWDEDDGEELNTID